MSGQRILVVEDNPDNMLLIVDILNTLEYTVFQAEDGASGVEVALRERPDLILMDLSLPKMDGWTATQTLKADPLVAHIPIIALTAHAMLGDRERAFQVGCDDYISKPINLPELLTKLKQYLG